MLTSLLIANRGEIACRIIRTARRLGIRTVAVYSDADAKALHVRSADEAVHIGPSPARESYLVGEKLIAAARATNAEAIHPGYGFLSENADFAQAVLDAGLIWVGPRPASILAMGLKDAAKARMAAAGVPVTPGYLGEDQSPDRLAAEADAIGYPILIKAVAGGGGKGMRRVDAAADFADALASCRREALAAFGNDHVLLEKYILSPRHIEVQVFGDTHGNIVHLFERDCSLQRRHQKVIEEAPAPGMDEATRAQICAAAVRAAQAVDYVGAGTIEFIADASAGLSADRIWFMEMNTRLQVEHPVTEEITGVDLVEWQLRVASGEALPKRQDELSISGHAIEARLYAEDPVTFLPSIGPLEIYRPRDDVVRVETGYSKGDEVTSFYDPMIEKLIAHAATRLEAADALANACAGIELWPVKTNAPFLWRALEHPAFLAGDVTTNFIENRKADLSPPLEIPDAVFFAGAVAIAVSAWNGRPTDVTSGKVSLRREGKGDIWREAFGFRLNAPVERGITVTVDGRTETVNLSDKWRTSAYYAELVDDGWAIPLDGQWFHATLPRGSGSGVAGDASGTILAPMPGRIIAVEVTEGQSVTKGQKLLTLEAMKMEHSLTAPFDGTVAELKAATGGQVQLDDMLARIEPSAPG